MPTEVLKDPIEWFGTWYEEAKNSQEPEPTAMCLSTVDCAGQPRARIVLLKDFDRKGFVFYTNLESAKGRELRAHPKAALTFLWKSQGRQVRIDGEVEEVSAEEADAYFASRPRGSQIGAWASKQSRALADRATLEAAVAAMEARFQGGEVPRPEHWSGFRVVPQAIEFWEAGEFRLHDRFRFERREDGGPWVRSRLYP